MKLLGYGGIVLSSILITVVLLFSDVLSEMENRTWDWRLQAVAIPTQADPSIKIIMIDQSSLEFFAQEESIFWPWPRGIYEAVTAFLKKGEARAAAFDIIFSEQSSYGVEDDASFANSLKGEVPIVSAVALRRTSSAERPGFENFRSIQAAFEKEHPTSAHYLESFSLNPNNKTYTSATLPIPEIMNASAGLGSVSAEPDSDGVYRHIPPGAFVNTTPILGLPFALYEAGRRSQPYLPIENFLNDQGRLAVNFHGPARTYPTYRISSIIQSFRQLENGETPTIDPALFKDSWVFVGMDAPGLLDLRPTPLSALYPGVEFHATVLDNLLHQNFATKTSSTIDCFIAILLAGSLSAIIIFLANGRLQLTIVIFLLGLFIAAEYYLAFLGYWLGMAVPVITALYAITSSLFFQYKLEGQQHRFIKGVFKSYVSPEVIEEIIRNPAALALGGAKRELTIFFSDLAGFTSLSESLGAEQLVSLLNQYLSAMTKIILAHGGTVDKYEGDAIIAFWNAPLEVPDHATRAIKTAIECQRVLASMTPAFEKEFGVSLAMRIGIHTGVANVGNFGSIDRFNYTIIGDAPNLASRLEGVNKVFGTTILFSEDTLARLDPPILARKIGDIKVVGRKQPVTVYSPIEDQELFETFKKALDCFEQGNCDDALRLFQSINHDGAAQMYIERIQKLDRQGAFDPVWVLTSK